MNETIGNAEQKQRRVFSSRSWWTALLIIALATWLTRETLISGEGWITVALGIYAGWQTRGYAERKLGGGN